MAPGESIRSWRGGAIIYVWIDEAASNATTTAIIPTQPVAMTRPRCDEVEVACRPDKQERVAKLRRSRW